jgi:uncharacterized protein YqjF (DUF2071 family)
MGTYRKTNLRLWGLYYCINAKFNTLKTFMTARWENLIMAKYAIDPAALRGYLPPGVEIDLFEGKAYVSLVGFLFKNSQIFGVPIPLLGTFEEVNLRFYVRRKDGNGYKRGVVFINETVPYKPVAWLANKLYKEHYIAIPTKHRIVISEAQKEVEFQWKTPSQWNKISVSASVFSGEMERGSLEEFIFEHYFGYTRLSETVSQEYRIHHPRWQVNKVLDATVDCNFAEMYGSAFAELTQQKPDAVFLAEGSNISVDWKRVKF